MDALPPLSPGPLGRLEEIAHRLAWLQRRERPEVTRKRLLLFAGSHGATPDAEGVTPGEHTARRVLSFMEGGEAVNIVARKGGIGLRLVDVGVDAALPVLDETCYVERRIRPRGFGGRLTPVERAAAMEAGREQVRAASGDGIHLLGVGRLGVGGAEVAFTLVGQLGLVPASKPVAPLAALERSGGHELAAIAGAVLEAWVQRIPVVLDGFSATAGAAAAFALEPRAQEVCFFAHTSVEPRHAPLLEALQAQALFDLALGSEEGVGAALAIHLMELAARVRAEGG